MAAVWRDSRVTFQNLKDDVRMNLIDHQTSRKLWIPPLGFPNSFGDLQTIDVDHGAYILVHRKNSTASFAQHHDLDENYCYRGQDNELVYYRRFQLTHQCSFDLQYYPFDTQYCKLKVLSTSSAWK